MPRQHRQSRFESSDAKDYLRSRIDRELVRRLYESSFAEIGLRYIGLPGPELLDVLSWREYLNFCTAFEVSNDAVEEMQLNILRNRLEGMVQIVMGDIDEAVVEEAQSSPLSWPYQIVNLDYLGGLINRHADGTSRRLETLRACLRRG